MNAKFLSRSRILLGMVILVCVTNGGLAQEKSQKDDKAAKQRPKPKFTVGKETTYVDGPLDGAGYVDFAAAINERLRQGVTPENNANVLFWRAMGPHPEGQPMPAKFFEWLKMTPPPKDGAYFVALRDFAREHLKRDDPADIERLDRELHRATQRPWTRKQYPDVAAWLDANAKPLALVVQGTQRSHYFSPLVTAETGKKPSSLIGALMSGVVTCREFASALAARAMLHLGEGRHDDAWKDLLACHRLGRHVGRGGTIIEGLVGVAIEHVASAADLAYLETAKPDLAKIARRQKDLKQLPAFRSVADQIDLTERLTFHDNVLLIARGGVAYLEGLSGRAPGKRQLTDVFADAVLATLNWDAVMRTGNTWFDRMTAALRIEDHQDRRSKLYDIEVDVKTLRSDLTKPAGMIGFLLGKSETKGKILGEILVTLLIPAFTKVQQAADRTQQVQHNTQIAFALAAYHREHGRYPKRLDALAPKYISAVAPDIFTGKPLVYRLTDNGYLLYSFGPDGRDDEGRWYEDEPEGDDPSVRMPLPTLRQDHDG